MLVKDKAGDIAILRTMGAGRGAIMRIFFIAGASIGVLGTLLGFAIGVVFCTYIEELRQLLSSLLGTTLFDPTIYFLSRIAVLGAPALPAASPVEGTGPQLLTSVSLIASWKPRPLCWDFA